MADLMERLSAELVAANKMGDIDLADVLRLVSAELAALRRDAERYRWLRLRIAGRDHVEEDFAEHPQYSAGEALAAEVDTAIDAAMAAERGEE